MLSAARFLSCSLSFAFLLLPLSSHALVKFKLAMAPDDLPVMVIASTSVNGLHGGGTSQDSAPKLVQGDERISIQPPLATPLFFSTVWLKIFHPGYLPVEVAVPKYAAVAGVVDVGTIPMEPVGNLLTRACEGFPNREVFSDDPELARWLYPGMYARMFQQYIQHMDELHQPASYGPLIQGYSRLLAQARAARAACPPPQAGQKPAPLYGIWTVEALDDQNDARMAQLAQVGGLTQEKRAAYFRFQDQYGKSGAASRLAKQVFREPPFAAALSSRLGPIQHAFDRSLQGKVLRWNNAEGDLSYEVTVGDDFIQQKRTCVTLGLVVALRDPALARLDRSRSSRLVEKMCFDPEAQIWQAR